MSDVTRILDAIQQGDPRAGEELLPLVYEELRRLAARKMAHEAPGQTLQPTALVHEAWLRLVGSAEQSWNSRGHFFMAAAEAMRRILIDNAILSPVTLAAWFRNSRTRLCGGVISVVTFTQVFGQPVITCQPTNQTNIVGTTAMFSVCATGLEPLSYQWRSHAANTIFTNIPFGTERTLVLTTVQPVGRRFAVVVTDVGGLSATSSPLASLTVLVPPSITTQPTNFATLSIGASVTNSVSVVGTAPFRFQWYNANAALLGQTNSSVVLTNLQSSYAGDYTVVVSNVAGSVTSGVSTLIVDRAFTKITTGPVVTDGGLSWGVSWGDYDNDGFLDLLVSNEGVNFLYHNASNGTFVRVTSGPIALDTGGSGRAWGDYDNEGDLDLFSAGMSGNPHRVYRNEGNGSFTRLTTHEIGSLAGAGRSGNEISLGDYDNDGYLDLFIANRAGLNEIYRGSASGRFTPLTTSPISGDGNDSLQGGWSDYDNDGDLDLLVGTHGDFTPGKFFYRNNGDGTFSELTAEVGDLLDRDGGHGIAWADYDNDGDLDVFVTGPRGAVNSQTPDVLYRNNGNGTFSRTTTDQVGMIASSVLGASAAWADYDNDRFLDLFVGAHGAMGAPPNKVNSIYHNNGDGTFSRIFTGSLVNDPSLSWGAAWGDYDNNGFMDLAVANGGFEPGGLNNFLYQNNGNSNHWLKLQLRGTVSNRSAIGAKVRLKATIRGTVIWQMREISGGDGFLSQTDLRPNFGLGDAVMAETVRIEWPSRIVQELHDVAANQILNVTEPGGEPRLAVTGENGQVQLTLTGKQGSRYAVETSTALPNWNNAARTVTVTNQSGAITFPAPGAPSDAQRFYRAVLQ